jgi:hypothetical protein
LNKNLNKQHENWWEITVDLLFTIQGIGDNRKISQDDFNFFTRIKSRNYCTSAAKLILKNFIHISPPFGAWVNGEERQVYNKTKNISFIASNKNMCEEHAFRHKMVNKFGKFCDVFGRGRKEISKKIEGLADYRFSFCMENHVTNLYYTEKLLDCFLSGTIPIFYGSRSISNVFDSNGIIWLNDILNGNVNINNLNEALYNSKIESVIKNFNIANEINNGVSNSLDKAITNGLK